jgi:hypothetical protein
VGNYKKFILPHIGYCLFTGSVEDPVRGARKGKKNIQAGKAKIASVEEFSQRLQKVESK